MYGYHRMKTLTLTRQLIRITVILLFSTALITSIPAWLLLRSELERQIDLRLDAGEQHSLSIWRLTEFQIDQTVQLVSQRPTLERLLFDSNETTLTAYLEDLRENTLLDFLYVVDEQHQWIAGTRGIVSENTAVLGTGTPNFTVERNLIGGQTIVGGILLDTKFLDSLASQTGFTYQYPDLYTSNSSYRTRMLDLTEQHSLLMWIDIRDIQIIQTSALVSIVTIALLTAGTGSLLGGLYMRARIRPLWKLRDSAKALGEGDLTSQITIEAQSPEIRTLTQTLETSRQRLNSTMQQLQQERDWSNSLMQSIVEGIVSVNSAGQIVFASESACEIMQWEQPPLQETIDAVFLLTDNISLVTEMLPAEGGYAQLDVFVKKHRITLAVTRARTLPDGSITLVLRDITEESRRSTAQAYYLANMSHEFRTPLSGMKASLELLINNIHELSAEERQQLLNSQLMSVSNLQRLIDNLLEGSKLQANQFSLHVQSVRLEQILADTLNTMQPLLQRRQQSLIISLPLHPLTVDVDRIRLVQVLVNLLSNASKYSPQSSEVQITLDNQGSILWVGVADRGQGVLEEQREVIFQQFVRLEQGAETDHSTGLGLSVVRGIIESHDGQVGVDAREGGGSIFWFSIPIRGK